jgi:hypothetical protein
MLRIAVGSVVTATNLETSYGDRNGKFATFYAEHFLRIVFFIGISFSSVEIIDPCLNSS